MQQRSLKAAILIVGHSQTEEWTLCADYFRRMADDSLLKTADVLAYVNCTSIRAAQVEAYLERFPQQKKFLLYTPMNGHSVADLPLDVQANVYKADYDVNRQGYLFGILEAYANTFDLLKQYDYVVQINPDVYVTNDRLERYLLENAGNDVVHHVNTMRGDVENGFSCDFTVYRPRLARENHFALYRHPDVLDFVLGKAQTEPNYRFVPEQILRHLVLKSGLKYQVICPSTRNNRRIDAYGIWHCHDNAAARQYLQKGPGLLPNLWPFSKA
ncbi:MAG TPA: hypothetical protein VF851_01305 [Steroidobacteraceae bacterium]